MQSISSENDREVISMFNPHDIFWFLLCMLCHVIDDFHLQGILASLKQRKYWEENAPDSLYKNDYKISLVIHSISWSFIIQIPLWIRNWETCTCLWCFVALALFVINTAIHAYVDDLKANRHKINLIADQYAHFVQIIWTFLILTYLPF